jgi:hypothetical protein
MIQRFYSLTSETAAELQVILGAGLFIVAGDGSEAIEELGASLKAHLPGRFEVGGRNCPIQARYSNGKH